MECSAFDCVLASPPESSWHFLDTKIVSTMDLADVIYILHHLCYVLGSISMVICAHLHADVRMWWNKQRFVIMRCAHDLWSIRPIHETRCVCVCVCVHMHACHMLL